MKTPSNGQLTFTPDDYSTAQTVTLEAAADNDDVGNGTRQITHSASNGGYDNKSATLTATEQDNDTASAAITLSASTVDVNENGTGTYTVKLSHKPGADVTVTLAESTTSPNNDSNITVKTPTGKSLTFTPDNYDTAQTVTLQATDDSDNLQGKRDIIHTVQTASGGYGTSVTATITATEVDDENNIIFRNSADNADITGLEVAEGGSATYKVKLNVLPTANVSVALTATGDSSITFSPSSLAFTPQNYDTRRR